MPAKIAQKTTYTLDIELASLQFKTKLEVDDQILRVICREVEELADALRDALGAFPATRKGTFTRHITQYSAHNAATNKLLEYASTHADFTIKGASEETGINPKTLYSAVARLVKEGTLKKEQVLDGIANIYTMVDKKQQKQTIAVLPNGKHPFPEKTQSPEREKMEQLRG